MGWIAASRAAMTSWEAGNLSIGVLREISFMFR
jgi:hypothetical protein